MPRALVNFTLPFNQAISAKPLNDQQEILVAIDLPVEFAYRMTAMNVAVVQDKAHSYRDRTYLEVTNAIRGLPGGNTQQWPLTNEEFDRIPTAVQAFAARFEYHAMPTDILQASSGLGAVITYKASNQTSAAAGAGTMNFLATFLEYDIEQAQRFPVHWPFMTYTRG